MIWTGNQKPHPKVIRVWNGISDGLCNIIREGKKIGKRGVSVIHCFPVVQPNFMSFPHQAVTHVIYDLLYDPPLKVNTSIYWQERLVGHLIPILFSPLGFNPHSNSKEQYVAPSVPHISPIIWVKHPLNGKEI